MQHGPQMIVEGRDEYLRIANRQQNKIVFLQVRACLWNWQCVHMLRQQYEGYNETVRGCTHINKDSWNPVLWRLMF